ncbi:hypothetical protein HYV11_03510 [Candidatus Dependentiae bacterium]|nr:hypothetical protein [Candidatus Dependentiae bacterium]
MSFLGIDIKQLKLKERLYLKSQNFRKKLLLDQNNGEKKPKAQLRPEDLVSLNKRGKLHEQNVANELLE